MAKPLFNTGAGQPELTMAPPFVFPGVRMRVFPLRADAYQLAAFCDRYLNIVPPEVAVFRPATPFVILAMINYGKLAPEVSNLGWVSQNEVAFTVLLEWYKRRNGRLVFHDWASVSPFIFVDSQTSLATGREVYGWPKVEAELAAQVDRWTQSPMSPRRVLAMRTMLFSSLYAGKRQEDEVFLEIDHQPRGSGSRTPPTWTAPWNPWSVLPELVRGSAELFRETMETLTRLPTRGFGPPPDTESQLAMIRRVAGSLHPLAPDLYNNTINLKQFRDAERPEEASYQALTRSRMRMERFNEGGLLGEQSILFGDLTGGYRIKLHRYGDQPIIDSLGLMTSREEDGHTGKVATLRPVVPYWLDLDMLYGVGEALAWRTQCIGWTASGEAPKFHSSSRVDDVEAPSRRPVPYNTARSGALQTVAGPFRFPDTTIRVLPLLADREKLAAFCSRYLKCDEDWCFEPFGSMVYLVVKSFEEMSSLSNNIGWWTRRQVSFAVPVAVRDAEGRLKTLGYVAPFKYADTSLGAITGREVNGWTTLQAEIEEPRGTWLGESGPAADTIELMKVTTDVLPALNVGTEVERRLLVGIVHGQPVDWDDGEAWRSLAARWAPRLFGDYHDKLHLAREHGEEIDSVRALALEVLCHGEPINEFSLKQFRDSDEPDRACYQAVVRSRERIEKVFDIREIDARPVHVAIHRYPTQPIVDTLGLAVKHTDDTGSSSVDYLQPIRPFWLRASIVADTAEELFYRAGTEEWFPRREVEEGFFEKGGATRVGRGLVEDVDRQEAQIAAQLRSPEGLSPMMHLSKPGEELRRPVHRESVPASFWHEMLQKDNLLEHRVLRKRRQLHEAARLWLEGRAPAELLTRAEAADALNSVGGIQAALEALLSHEWGNWGEPLWWQAEQVILARWETVEAKEFRHEELTEEEKHLQDMAPEVWARITSRQRPSFVVRADSLGPWGPAYQRDQGLAVHGDYWWRGPDDQEPGSGGPGTPLPGGPGPDHDHDHDHETPEPGRPATGKKRAPAKRKRPTGGRKKARAGGSKAAGAAGGDPAEMSDDSIKALGDALLGPGPLISGAGAATPSADTLNLEKRRPKSVAGRSPRPRAAGKPKKGEEPEESEESS